MPIQLNAPGFFSIPSNDYHADPAPAASLSHSIVRTLLDRSPRHAKYAHPRISPEPLDDESTDAMDAGTVLHHLILGGGTPPVIVAADSFRTAAAKDQRDAARAAGRVPILAHKLAELSRCAEAVKAQMRERPECAEFFAPGRSEVTLLWRELEGDAAEFWCRSLVDRLPDDPAAPLFDLKSVANLTTSARWPRDTRAGYCSQAAFYLRGARALGREPRHVRFILFERTPPFCIHVAIPGQTAIERGEKDVMDAMKLWIAGLHFDQWPGVSTEAEYFELPPHELADALLDKAANPNP